MNTVAKPLRSMEMLAGDKKINGFCLVFGRTYNYFGKPIIPLRRSCDSAPDGLGFSPKTRNSDRMPGGGPLLFAPDAVQVFSGFKKN